MPLALTDLEGVFGALAEEPRWVGWRWETRGGKPTKPPINPATGTYARNDDPSTWGTLAEAAYARDERGLAGVGIELGGGLGGVDLDGCRDPETGEIREWARRIIDGFRSYTEVSPSGTGVKILASGAPDSLPVKQIPMAGPPIGEKSPGVEAYVSGRYFTVTGDALPGLPAEIVDCGEIGGGWDRLVRLLTRRGETSHANGDRPGAPAGAGLPDDVRELLGTLSPDCPHDEWLRVGMALHHADPDEGLPLWDEWSAAAPDRYPGPDEIRRRWGSFQGGRGNAVTLGTLRHMAAERGYRPAPAKNGGAPHPDRSDDHTLTDTGNASRLIALHGERLRYVPTWGKWITDPGTGFWRVDHRDVFVRELAKDVGRTLRDRAAAELRHAEGPEQAAPSRKMLSFGLKSLEARRIRDMVDLARGIDGIPLHHEELDADAWLLGAENGVVDLRTGQLRRADPRDLMTMQAPVPYDPEAKAPRFGRAMEEWFPDPDTRAYVQRVAGSALVGAQQDHVLIIHYGGGGNGKGTFVGAVQNVLGSYARVVHLSLLVELRHKEHDTVKADLFRARLAIAAETERRVRLAEASVKNLTGGDRITARRMREDPWEFDPSHSLWLQTNHLPEIGGRDAGIWRRIRVVKWVSTFDAKAADPGLKETLRAEGPGILAWLVRGCLRWQEEGLAEPDAVLRDTLEYRAKEDVFSRFAADTGLTFEGGLRIQAQELQDLLVAWASEEGIDAPRTELGAWLRDQGCDQKVDRWRDTDGKRRQARFWRGVGTAGGGV